VSTTPGNPGNLLEFENPPGNPGNLLEFKWSSSKFLCNDRPHWYPVITLGARLLLEETGPPILSLIWPHVVGWSSSSHAPLNIVHSVHYISGRNNANMSWIFLKIPPGISWKSPGNLFS